MPNSIKLGFLLKNLKSDLEKFAYRFHYRNYAELNELKKKIITQMQVKDEIETKTITLQEYFYQHTKKLARKVILMKLLDAALK